MAYNLRSSTDSEVSGQCSVIDLITFLKQEREERDREREERRQEKVDLHEHIEAVGQRVSSSITQMEGRVDALGVEVNNVRRDMQAETDRLRAEFNAELRRLACPAPLNPAVSLSPRATPFVPNGQRENDSALAAVDAGRSSNVQPPSIPTDFRPIQRPTSFDGKTPWEAYSIQFETVAEINKWGQEEKARFLISSLTGPALAVLQTMPQDKRKCYPHLVAALEARFSDGKTGEFAKISLQERVRRSKESLPELAADIEFLVRKAYPTIDEKGVDSLACDYFVRALTHPEVRQQVKFRAPTTLRQALEIAIQIEVACLTDPRTITRHQVRAMTSLNEDEPTEEKINLERQIEKVFRQVLEELIEKLRTDTSRREQGRRVICYRCSRPGHIARNCRQPKRNEDVKPAGNRFIGEQPEN